MALTSKEIIAHLKYPDAEPLTVTFDKMKQREIQVVGTNFYFEIVNCGPVPPETVKYNVMRELGIEDTDGFHLSTIEEIEDGIDLCREVCQQLGLPFSDEDANTLRKKVKKNGTLLLFIIERPVAKG
jgi:hypothetical protein